jgi:peroxin-13
MYGGMGQPGMMGTDPNDPNSLTNTFSQSTQATFQIIESIVGAFQGVAQMLESTYMATHSSFFGEHHSSSLLHPTLKPFPTAMVSVAEQFTNLRNTLGSILGIFTILRWLRTLFAKVSGRPPPADATSLTPSAFASFRGLPPSSAPNHSSSPSPSRKPFLVFVLAAFGLPYLMSKLIRSLASQSPNNPYNQPVLGPDGTILPGQQLLDPSKLEFCRVLYDYNPIHNPSTGHASATTLDLSVKKGDLVAVLSKLDPMGRPSDWWRCRSRDGRVGYLPGVYLEAVKKRAEIEERAMTLSTDQEGSRTNSLKVEGAGSVVEADEKNK